MNQEKFENTIEDVTSRYKKINKDLYQTIGKYKIIDQGKEFIGGYTDNENLIVNESLPVIIFGDHTRELKYIDFPFAIGADGVKVLKIIKNKAYPKYVYYFLKSKPIKNTGYNRHFKFLKSIKIPIPENLADQIRIAEVLTKVETLIEQRKESIDLLDDFLKSTFLDMFGQGYKSIFPIEKLIDVSKKITDGEHGTVKRLDKGRLYLMARNITSKNELSFEDVSYISEDDHQKIFKRCNPEKNDLLMVCVGATIGKVALVPNMEDFSIARSVALIKPDFDKINSNYLLWFFNTEYGMRQIKKGSNEAAQAGLYTGNLKKIKIPIPPIKLQNKFALIVEKADNVKEQYKESLKELENLFGSLSQKAFKGELDLSKLDVSAQIREIEKKVEAESGLDISLETKLTKQMQQFIEQTEKLQKALNPVPDVLSKALEKQIETINKISAPFQNLKAYQISEELAVAMKSFDSIKSIASTLNEEKKSTWSSMRDLGELENLQFDETEGLELIEIVFSKRKEGFTFEDFENLLRKEKFKYSYKQIQQFIFKLIAEKKLTQHFLSNKKENRLLQLKEDNNEIFFGDERIWLKYNK